MLTLQTSRLAEVQQSVFTAGLAEGEVCVYLHKGKV